MKKLNITELETYLNLAYKRSERLARSLSMYPGDKAIHDEYEKNFKIIEMLEKEANERIDKLAK